MNRFKILLIALLFGTTFFAKSQNTGPVAPEAVSFEPVDANNMVNMYTGDFSYVIPILNIPGPEGGYPIALSYHGGVTMDQEASWVGLGWNINPGAITRSVNGCPDDWTGQVQNIKGHIPPEDIDLYSVGLDVGLFKVVSVGVSYTWGAYRSVGVNAGFFVGTDKNSRLGFGAGLSYDSHSGKISPSASVGIKLGDYGILGLSSDGSVNLSAFDKQRNIGAGFSLSSQGFSFSARGSGMGVGVGVSKQDNGSKDGWHHRTESSGISVPICFITLSYSHQRYTYWYNKIDDFAYYGALYTKNSAVGPPTGGYDGIQDKRFKMDVYEIDYDENSLKPDADVSKNNLILPAYDSYNVTAQGLAGTFSPKYYSNVLLCGDSYKVDANGENDVSFFHWWYAGDLDFNVNPYFYFDSDISGYVQSIPGTFSSTSSTGGVQGMRYSGNTVQATIDYKGKTEIGYVNKRRTTGNWIEWFTNDQINNRTAKSKGFIEDETIKTKRLIKKDFDPDGIGGFMVTTPDGKTYHYSIPVYEREEFIRKNGSKIGSYSESRKLSSYAFTWLLTAITGPDYIDNNMDGFLDNEDTGYWVKFKYDMYTDGYIWQFPYDLEGESYNTYKKSEIHFGRKQIYYLNSIETKTHVAYFIKDIRDDGLSSAREYKPGIYRYANSYLLTDKVIRDLELPSTPCAEWDKANSYYDVDFSYSITEKTKPLKLDRIILCKKNGIAKAKVNPCNTTYGAGTLNIVIDAFFNCAGSGTLPYQPRYVTPLNTNIDNLYLTSNTDLNDVKNQIIKEVDFKYSYELCGMTPNSDAPNKGKLTLKSLELLGRNGYKTMPAYIFDYHLPSSTYVKDGMDPYGYKKESPENWTLKEITLPVGGKIRVDYEKNTFKNEAVYGNRAPIVKSWFEGNIPKIKVAADIKSFQTGDVFDLNGELNYTITVFDDHETLHENHNAPVSGSIIISSVSISDSTLTLQQPTYFPHPERLDGYNTLKGFICNLPNNFTQYGGGVRVSKLSLVDELGHEYVTEYDYSKPGTTNTSGAVPYSMYYLNKKYVPYLSELPSPKVVYGNVTIRQFSNGQLNPAISTYEFESYNNAKTENLFSLEMEGQFKVINQQDPNEMLATQTGNHDGKIYARSSTLWNNLGIIGRLKSIKSLNPLDQVFIKETHTYYDPADIQIGVQQETYNAWKRYCSYYNNRNKSHSVYNFTATSRVTYPSLAKSVITESTGLSREITNNVYDFNTGNVLSTLTMDYDGTEYRTDILPAYKIPVYSGMGLKSIDINNKNMLSQEAANLSYIKVGENWMPVGVGVQTWNNGWFEGDYNESCGCYLDESLPNVWRKHKTFSWRGNLNADGTYGNDFIPYSTTDSLISHWSDFNGIGINGWQKTSEVTRYNRYSQPLEVIDINGHASSSRLDLNATKTVAIVSNARFSQFTGCGFEDFKATTSQYLFEGQVLSPILGVTRMISANSPSSITGIRLSGVNAHTGNRYIKLNGGVKGPFVNIPFDRKQFRVSLWVHKNTTNVAVGMSWLRPPTGDSHSSSVTMDNTNSKLFGDWYLFTPIITMPQYDTGGGQFYIECNGEGNVAYIDDFRVQPLEASTSAYVYDPITDAVTYILNNDNIATRYEYDDAGNLRATYKETPTGFKKVSEHNQGYARPLDNVFTLASEIEASSDINIVTGMRTVSATINVTNNDMASRNVNFTVNLEGAYLQNISGLIGSKQSRQFTVTFEISSGVDETRLITIAGDIQAMKSIFIPMTPPSIRVKSFAVDPTGQVSLGSSVEVRVELENFGTATGDVVLKWRHTTPDSGVEYSDQVQFQLAPGATITLHNRHVSINAIGVHLLGFDWVVNNVPYDSYDVSVECGDGSNPHQ